MINSELYPSRSAFNPQEPRLCSAHNPSTLRYAGQARLHYITPDKRRISAGSSEPASPHGRESSFPERMYVKELSTHGGRWVIVGGLSFAWCAKGEIIEPQRTQRGERYIRIEETVTLPVYSGNPTCDGTNSGASANREREEGKTV